MEKENERGTFPDSYYFDTVNKDATYEITIEASYPEVKGFSYNLYVLLSYDLANTTAMLSS